MRSDSTVRTMVLAAATILVIHCPRPSSGELWQIGDVFVAIGDGSYRVYDRQGDVKHLLHDNAGGYTTDCGFEPTLDRVFTVNYTHTKVVVYDDDDPESMVAAFDASSSPGSRSTSLTFDTEGSFYVGHADGDGKVHKYDESGQHLASYGVAVDRRGSNWLDLAVDQKTLFYTSDSRKILRYDVEKQTQEELFAILPGEGHAGALRLLPPGDGSGGLIVADEANIKRVDGQGRVVGIYDDNGRDAWFAISLDPDGKSFWAADSETDHVYRFALSTGAIIQRLVAGPGNTIFGVCIKGELTAAVPQVQALPEHYSLSQNAPNPFNPTTQISFSLPEPGPVKLVVYNALGQRIRTLIQTDLPAGRHRHVWDARDDLGRSVGSGVYFYRFTSAGLVQARRMVVLK